MTEHSDYSYFLKELFPGVGADLLRLLQGAADNAHLLRSDFYTIRDWIEIAGYHDEAALHVILLVMMIALEEGSLCVEIAMPALVMRLQDLVPEPEARAWAERIVQAIVENRYPALVGSAPKENRPVILAWVHEHRFLYFQRYLRAEVDFQRELHARIQRPLQAAPSDWPRIVRDVLDAQPLPLDREQRLALGTALCSNFTIISGGPGTGKTTIVLTLLRCLVRGGVAPDRIALAAPTGRAAQRLSDSLRAGLDRLPSAQDSASPESPLRNLAACTLHQLLGYRPTRNVFARHRENPIAADVVIVDEVSMVGLLLMAQLLDALEPKTKLVLLGDKDQLPSVEAGAILAGLIGAGPANRFTIEHGARLTAIFPDLQVETADSVGALGDRIVLLQTNHRSQPRIREAAQAINVQDVGIVDRLPALHLAHNPIDPGQALEIESGCWLLEQIHGSPNELRGFLQHWVEIAYFRSRVDGHTLAELIDAIELADGGAAGPDEPARLRQLFTLLDRYRLLTLVRDGPWGCDEINRFLEMLLRPKLDAGARGGLFAGAPVLITRNDAARGLYNGDVGITLRNGRGGLCVLLERHDGFLAIPAEALPAHELGFALTVHKSQGSEYANVMVVLPPTGGKRLLTKELLYTAITRAKSAAVICSSKEVLKFAISRRNVRDSGILLG